MRRPLLLALAVAPLMASGLAHAADVDCKNPADQTSMNICADRDLKAANGKLNETWRALLDKTSKPGREKLLKAQRAWIVWRDAQCDFNTLGSAGGSIHPMVHSLCLTQLTQAQTKLLDGQLHCEEGDTSCGGQ